MIYTIVTSLRVHDFDYNPLYDKIKSIGDYIQAMDCLWFVYTEELLNVSEVVKDLNEDAKKTTTAKTTTNTKDDNLDLGDVLNVVGKLMK